MFKTISIVVFVCLCFCCALVGNLALADDPNSPNYVPEGTQQGSYAMGGGDYTLEFDPSDYAFLVYDPHGSSNSDIQKAMTELGITDYELRTASNPVTQNDLNTHDILIVGWNSGGYMGGLSSVDIETGINGRVLLTGHDADYHTANTLAYTPKAKTFMAQSISYILNGSGTGLLMWGGSGEQSLFDIPQNDMSIACGIADIEYYSFSYSTACG